MTRARLYVAAQAVVLVLTAIILVFLGNREFIGYDSYWHVFIARQDRWPNFWHEVRENAHPPLFYLLLRTASWLFGSTLLGYRAVSIGATLAATAIVAAVVRRMTSNRPLAIVAAAAFAFSYGVIVTALEVRAYALCAAFTLLALLFHLDWLRAPARRQPTRIFAGFAVAATLAVVTHYSTFFFLAAVIATPIALALLSRAWRVRLAAKISTRPLATALMLGVPVVAAVAAYVLHVGLWGGGRLSHVPDFMFNPATETPWRFVLRNTLNLAAIVVPGGNEFISGIYNSLQRVAIAVLGGVALAGLVQLGRRRAPRLAAVPVVITTVMVALNAAGGLMRRYPYGGVARHEFFIVPFVLVCFFGLVEVVRRSLPRRFARRWLSTAVVGCGVLASIASWTSTFRVQPQALFQPQMTHFRSLVPSPRAVLLDQFTFINFFSHHHDWQWRLGGEWIGQQVWQVWLVSKDDKRMAVCRDAQWSLEMTNIATYDSVVECVQRSGVGRVAIFRTHWREAPPAIAVFDKALAAEDGLTTTSLGADGNDVYAEFDVDPAVLHDCSTAPPAPAGLHVVSNSDRVVVLTWAPAGGTRTSYIIEAGLRPGLRDVLNMPLGRATTYTATRVNPATYYARVRARNVCGVSAASGEIRITVP
jgi:4-amino-4-deoxy-L-arabinose transferase-like glycosyltransferase